MGLAIDEPTLVTFLGLASLTASGLFFSLSAYARHIPGVRYWGIGALGIGMGMVLDGPRLIEDWRYASLVFNIPFSAGQAFILAGTMDFCGRPRVKETLWFFTLLASALTVYFTFIDADSRWRIASLSAHQVVINVWTAVTLWRHADAFARPAFIIVSLTALLQAAASLVQGAVIAASSGDLSYGAPQLPLANIISWCGALFNTLVGNAMLFLLIMLRLVSELRRAAECDALTGLLNRRGMRLHFDALLARMHSGAGSVGILILDIDHFKTVNDTHGHDMGDRVLALMGEILLQLNHGGMKPSRWGGEEFCVVVEGTSRDALVALAEDIRIRFQRACGGLPDLRPVPTVSVGIALAVPEAGFDISQLISVADAQLYRAKVSGRDCIAVAA